MGQYWTSGDELKGGDIGLDLAAGIHIWSFDIEAHAQYGLLDLGTRWDGSTVRHQFFWTQSDLPVCQSAYHQKVLQRHPKE
ncbi:MAG: hypothetical protein IPL46_22595 [Saprospiraceae bacterium]|nr:hypothetical protein [Saprospiraceae bacterium]